MDGGRLMVPLVLALGLAGGSVAGQEGDAFAVRLVHPDRQAVEILRLFEGARWGHPAAALAAWKEGRPFDSGLGKPAEALIAFFNPEMAREWRALDDAEFRVGADRRTGEMDWCVVIPRDDGTVAAGLTAMRMTYPDARPLAVDGEAIPVARLGRAGIPLACQAGTAVIVAGSRERLERGVALAKDGRNPATGARVLRIPDGFASGTVFRVDPAAISGSGDGSMAWRRAIAALHASGCGRLDGFALLKEGSLVVDVSASVEGRPGPARPARVVERAWLESLPSEGVMAMVSVAVDPDPAAWDRAFAAADRVEKVDPARAGLAPLRTRLNLLAIGAGVTLEADVRPHLRGISACLIGEAARPGRIAGGLVVLHLDEPGAAGRLAGRIKPRIWGLVGGDDRANGAEIEARGSDVRIAWGKRGRSGAGPSVAGISGGWEAEGRPAPSRVGAFWPARVWRPGGLAEASARALAEDPPVVWWGWSEPGHAHDRFRWAGLKDRVQDFLAAMPADSGPAATIPAAQVPSSNREIKN